MPTSSRANAQGSAPGSAPGSARATTQRNGQASSRGSAQASAHGSSAGTPHEKSPEKPWGNAPVGTQDGTRPDPQLSAEANPLIAQLTHVPFPEVAEVLRTVADQITHAWDTAVRQAMPQMRHLTFDELKDSTPQILLGIAAALESDDPDLIRDLFNRSPSQGLSRFKLHFDVVEVMQEDRLLRGIIVQHVEAALGRRMETLESAAMHTTIDIMLQQSVIALVDQQKSKLAAAAENELKFLSFLSHDLNNNLNSVTLMLHAHGVDLRKAGGFSEAEASLDDAKRCIYDTVTGMRRMLDHARLQDPTKKAMCLPVDLHSVAQNVRTQFAREANAKGVQLIVDISPGSVVESDVELLLLIVRNLVGNGVKYSRDGGTVRIGSGVDAGTDAESHRPMLWVSDNGPGIAAEKLKGIFDAFQRGDNHGQHGVGLGLTIASQAAKLVGAMLTVESEVGVGSTFRMTFI